MSVGFVKGETDDPPPISMQQIIHTHRAMSAGPRGGAGKGESVYPVPVDINQIEIGVYP